MAGFRLLSIVVGACVLKVQATQAGVFSPKFASLDAQKLGRHTMMPSKPTSTTATPYFSLSSTRLPTNNKLDTLSTSSSAVLLLRGGEVTDIVEAAYEWCTNLGSPSALVAGAVIATIYENMGSGALNLEDKDSKLTKFMKRLCRVLLLSAFALEVLSIFTTTVTGTMLLAHTEDDLDALVAVTKDTTVLSFLRDNFEFEYLTARITFLQGLFHWLGAISLRHLIPSGDESKETRDMDKFIGASLLTTMILMMAFYNNHMNFYPNYACMLGRWVQVILRRFVFKWPPRPSVILFVPAGLWTAKLGYHAFFPAPSQSEGDTGDKEDDKASSN